MGKTDKGTRLAAPNFILGLDMSLEHTGWCLANLKTGEVCRGLIEPKGRKGMERLQFLRSRVLNLARYGVVEDPPVALRIDCLVFIEHYAFGARGTAMISLGELGGVIRLGLHDWGIPYIEIPPTQAKKFVTGKGNVNKNIVLKEMLKRFGEDLDDDNIADATGLMYLGRAVVGKEVKPLAQFQEQVVSDVVKSYLKESKTNVNAA